MVDAAVNGSKTIGPPRSRKIANRSRQPPPSSHPDLDDLLAATVGEARVPRRDGIIAGEREAAIISVRARDGGAQPFLLATRPIVPSSLFPFPFFLPLLLLLLLPPRISPSCPFRTEEQRAWRARR